MKQATNFVHGTASWRKSKAKLIGRAKAAQPETEREKACVAYVLRYTEGIMARLADFLEVDAMLDVMERRQEEAEEAERLVSMTEAAVEAGQARWSETGSTRR